MASRNYFPIVMKSTAVITAVMTAVLALVYHFCPLGWVLSAAITAFTTCYHFSMRLLIGCAVPLLASRPDPNSRWFRPRSFEAKLYALLRVKQWKGHMPTYDERSFSLAHNTLEQVIVNSCVAELVHEAIAIFSFIPLLFALVWDALPVFIITSMLAALFDSIFVIMQRYNRPRLVRISKKKEVPVRG